MFGLPKSSSCRSILDPISLPAPGDESTSRRAARNEPSCRSLVPIASHKPGILAPIRRSERRPSYNTQDLYPVILSVDNSPSTLSYSAQRQIEYGLRRFISFVRSDSLLSKSIEIAIYTFGSRTTTRRVLPFTPAAQVKVPTIEVDSWGTPLYQLRATTIAEAINHQRRIDKSGDREVHPVWIFEFTDGEANDDECRGDALTATCLATERNIKIFPFACGTSPNLDILNAMSQPNLPPHHVSEANYHKCFKALYELLQKNSVSQVGDILTDDLSEEAKSVLHPNWIVPAT